MEMIKPLNGSIKRYWRRRTYQRLDASRRNIRVARFGGSAKKSWRMRIIPKLRIMKMVSPMKLLKKLKNGYMNMMLNLVGNIGYFTNGNAFGGKRIPKARHPQIKYSNTDFENRLIYEICKSMVPHMELYNP